MLIFYVSGYFFKYVLNNNGSHTCERSLLKMALSVYLNFDGNCREAVEFYADVFNTEMQEIMTFDQMPPDENVPVPEEIKDKILHTHLDIQGTMVMFSDLMPGMGPPLNMGNNVSLTVVSSDMAELQRLYDRLKEGGSVEMELQETFWSKAYASVTDRFGIPWQLISRAKKSDSSLPIY
jgi:PhnB protein